MGLKTPLPLGNSYDLPWGGYGIFLELHMEGFCGNRGGDAKDQLALKSKLLQSITTLEHKLLLI